MTKTMFNDGTIAIFETFGWLVLLTSPIFLPFVFRPLMAKWAYCRIQKALQFFDLERAKDIPSTDVSVNSTEDYDLEVLRRSLDLMSVAVMFSHETDMTPPTERDQLIIDAIFGAMTKYQFAAQTAFTSILIVKTARWCFHPFIYFKNGKMALAPKDWLLSLACYITLKRIQGDFGVVGVTAPTEQLREDIQVIADSRQIEDSGKLVRI